MDTYRIYILNKEDRISGKMERAFPNDREALKIARDLSAGQYAAEVWAGERLVARMGGELCLG